MRILQVVKSSLAPSGQNNTVHHLADALGRRGHDVTVLALRRRAGERESLPDGGPHAYALTRVRLPRTRGYFHDLIFSRAIRAAAVEGYGIVHAHMLHPEGYCAMKALSRLRTPLVVTGHGEDIQVDEACGYGVRRDPRIDRRVRRVLGAARALVAISEAMREQMIDAGALEEKIRVIRWGCHLPAGAGAPPERPGYLLSVGRLVPKKGYDLLLRAMRHLVDARPSERLLIAGEGPCRDELVRLIAELNLTGHVTLVGFVSGGALTSLYRGARLFVCPSRWEPLGLVNLEAMSCGLPVVAFRIDGIPDIVRDGSTGLLAPPLDPAALASAMRRVLDDPALRDRMAMEAAAAAAEHRWEKVAADHEALYEVIAKRRADIRAA